MTNIHAWQQATWQHLAQAQRKGNLAHAYLLHGMAGLGKRDLAIAFAATLLCTDTRQDVACGQCPHCLLFQAGTHPDYYPVSPEKNTTKIDQVRQLIRQLSQTRHSGAYQVAIITHADTLNVAAANALLKVVEEPSAETLILLVCDSLSALPATLRSRCQQLHVAPATAEQTADYFADLNVPQAQYNELVALTDGAPMLVQRYLDEGLLEQYQGFQQGLQQIITGFADPLNLAKDHANTEMLLLLHWIERFLQTALRAQFGLTSDDPGVPFQAGRALQMALFSILDKLTMVRNLLQQGSQINQQLVLEDVFTTTARLRRFVSQ